MHERRATPRLDLASTGQRALDVGCGMGALTEALVVQLGAAAVAAVDPSEPFVAATRARYPGVDVRRASAEALPGGGRRVPSPGHLGGPPGRAVRGGRAAGCRACDTARPPRAAHVDAWWEPFTHGAGPAGAYLASLDDVRRAALRDACRRSVPTEPFTVTAVAWAARGTA